jgi:hypothetical protein
MLYLSPGPSLDLMRSFTDSNQEKEEASWYTHERRLLRRGYGVRHNLDARRNVIDERQLGSSKLEEGFR